jgi:hypothetical protein
MLSSLFLRTQGMIRSKTLKLQGMCVLLPDPRSPKGCFCRLPLTSQISFLGQTLKINRGNAGIGCCNSAVVKTHGMLWYGWRRCAERTCSLYFLFAPTGYRNQKLTRSVGCLRTFAVYKDHLFVDTSPFIIFTPSGRPKRSG